MDVIVSFNINGLPKVQPIYLERPKEVETISLKHMGPVSKF